MTKTDSKRSQSTNPSYKRLHQSASNKVFLGVLGGFGEYLNVDATLLRLLFIVLTIFTGFFPGLLLYLFAAVLMPKT